MPVWLFFGCVYLGSWACWLPFVLVHRPTSFVLLLFGLMMPSLFGIVFTSLTQDRKGRREFWSRVTSVRRIGLEWFALLKYWRLERAIYCSQLFTLTLAMQIHLPM